MNQIVIVNSKVSRKEEFREVNQKLIEGWGSEKIGDKGGED